MARERILRRGLRNLRWLLVAPSMLLWWLLGQFDKTNVSLIIAHPSFLSELKLEGRNAELGGLMSAFFFGYGVAVFLWGFLVDRWGPRKCLMGGTLIWSLVLFWMSRATDLQELLVARFLLGAAAGNMWPVSNALTNRWFPLREHSRAQAFWMTGAPLGTALGIPVVSFLMVAHGWRGMLLDLAFLSLLPIVSFTLIADDPRRQKRISPQEVERIETSHRQSAATPRMHFRELLRASSFWLLTFCYLVSVLTTYTMIQWLPRFLITQRGLSFRDMTLWITLGYLLATGVTLLLGYIADRTMRRALTASGACFALVLLVLPGAYWLPAIGSALVLGMLLAVPVIIAALNGALLHSLVQPEAVARGTGIYAGIGSLLSAVGPIVFGASITLLGGQYWGGFLFLAVLNALGALCYYALHRMSPRTKQPAAVPVGL